MKNTTELKTDLYVGDLLDMSFIADDTADLCFTSPPYEDTRLYDIGFKLKADKFVDWAFVRFLECLRVTRGVVCWVLAGKTRKFSWSGVPVLLMAKLLNHGVTLRDPCIFHRQGICGSGGPDWLRHDYEFIICATKRPGRLHWSDNTAAGHPRKYDTGGEFSYRTKSGKRVNDNGGTNNRSKKTNRKHDAGSSVRHQRGRPPITNPGNVFSGRVGGGHMGSAHAHRGEAAFPEWLVEPFVKSFCPPGGTVIDPFVGTGTTVAVAKKLGRNGIGIDIRQSQIDITKERLAEIDTQLVLNFDGKKTG